MEIRLKTIGYGLISIAVLLLVLLTFVKLDVDKQSVALCEQVSETGGDMASCPVHKSNISWIIMFAFGIAFLMFGAGIYLVFAQEPAKPIEEKLPIIAEEKKEFKQFDLAKLDEAEKKVYELIKSRDGSAYQSDLVRETSFGKVRVTRILDKLEQMGILERRRRGMTNIIVLK